MEVYSTNAYLKRMGGKGGLLLVLITLLDFWSLTYKMVSYLDWACFCVLKLFD